MLFVNETIEKKLFNLFTKNYFLQGFIYSREENQFALLIIIFGCKGNEKSTYIYASGDFGKCYAKQLCIMVYVIDDIS